MFGNGAIGPPCVCVCMRVCVFGNGATGPPCPCVCMYEGGVCLETGLLDLLVHGKFSLSERGEYII